MKRLNVNCDFKIIEKHSLKDSLTPFTFVYKVGSIPFEASFDGEKYTNCKKLDNGDLQVVFNSHYFKTGIMSVERTYFLKDNDYPDGVCKLTTTEQLSIELTNGATDGVDAVEVVIGEYYTTIPDKNFLKVYNELKKPISVDKNIGSNVLYNVGEAMEIAIDKIEIIPYKVSIIFNSGEVPTVLNIPTGTKHIGTVEIAPNSEYIIDIELGILKLSTLSSVTID